jgi:hypothetical protein
MRFFKSTVLAMAIGLVFIPGALAQFSGGFRGNTNNSVPTQEPFGNMYLVFTRVSAVAGVGPTEAALATAIGIATILPRI